MRKRRGGRTGLLIVGIGSILVAVLSIEDLTWVSDSDHVKRMPDSQYSPPRTPWGDPDLQGAYTNTGERGIPLERPADWSPGVFERVSRLIGKVTGRNDVRHAPRPTEWEPTFEDPPRHSRRWLVSDPQDGKVPPSTPEVARRREAAAARWRDLAVSAPWAAMDPFVRCISRGMPASMVPTIYGNAYDITQAPGVVAIRYEMVNETRVIALDGRAHVGRGIRSYMGDARGRFDGDVLVVESTNFGGRTPFWGSSEHLHLTERFIPVSGDTIEWSVTLDDPATWESPWTFALSLTRTSARPLEFACHEGNYSFRNTLAVGTR